ncbi:MAG TPA: outer membrane protein assembly factor BamA [Ignavibacteria bacterium]|nr:outer membrane protein assembly factor BamA [Ignavibacteria bacterium]HMQ99193.1 outer membrane protein assembly factor BamA [Ignavibacteria bacterium]
MRDIKKVLFLFFALIFTLHLNVFAQDGPRTYKILSINAEGNKFYDSRIIVSNSGLKVGDEIMIPSEATQSAIMNLWNMKLFSDVEIVVDKKVGDGAYLVIKVKELPKLDNIKFSGNDEFSDKDLEEKIPLETGQVITPQTVKDIEYNITKLYETEGYPLATVKVDQFVNSYNEAQLRVKISEGKKISVRHIRFAGNSRISSGDLKGAMEETSERKWWKFWDKARFNRNDYEKDKEYIIDYYKQNGFKDATIIEDKLDYKNNKEDVDILIKVAEGPKYKIGNITFEGNTVYKDSVLIEKLDMKRGDVFNYMKFNQNLRGNESQSDIASLYLDNGYLGFNADVDETVKENNYVDLKINISENRQYRVGLISFSGNSKTQDKVIRRELFTLPGQYFNKTAMVRSMQQISQLNYFNPEALNYDFVQRNDSTVDLVYLVEERSSDQLNASVGYSQTFGFSGSLGLTFNNFDILDPLSGGAGQILSLQWDFGTEGTYRTFRIGFTEPWLFNTPTSAGIDLYDTKQNYTYEIQETGSTLNIGRRFRFPDDYFRGDWFLKFQRTNVINGAGIYETGLRTQISIGQVISRNSTNSPIFPSVGSKISLSAEIAGANIIGTTNFYKLGFKSEAYKSLDNAGKLVLASLFDIESISSLSSDNYVPPNELFFMGGSGLSYNTVALRGYDDRSVGPVNSIRSPVGGRFMMKYGVELRYSLSQDPIPIFLTMFAEAGNLWSSFKTADIFDLKRSVGFGARLMLPAVGIIGFDLGYGFDRKVVDNEDPSWLFHFQFGRGF